MAHVHSMEEQSDGCYSLYWRQQIKLKWMVVQSVSIHTTYPPTEVVGRIPLVQKNVSRGQSARIDSIETMHNKLVIAKKLHIIIIAPRAI